MAVFTPVAYCDLFLFSLFSLSLSLSLSLLFCFVGYSAAPVLEEVIKSRRFPEGRVSGNFSWKLAVSFLSNTLFVTIIESLFSTVSCTIDTTDTLVLRIDDSIECWKGDHRIMGFFAIYAVM